MKIRPAAEADAAPIAALLGELGYRATAGQVLDRLKSPQPLAALHLVAESADGMVAGFLAACRLPYFPNGSTVCRITTMVVLSSHRRTGAGRALVEAAAAYARKHGCSGLEVTTAEHRLDAHAFYARNGFARTSSRFFREV